MINLKADQKQADRFDKNQGEGATEKFKKILWQTGSLAEVGRQFGFSRTYACSAFRNIFNIDIKKYKRKRSKILTPPRPKKRYETLDDLF